jgi:hypothetical protein
MKSRKKRAHSQLAQLSCCPPPAQQWTELSVATCNFLPTADTTLTKPQRNCTAKWLWSMLHELAWTR